MLWPVTAWLHRAGCEHGRRNAVLQVTEGCCLPKLGNPTAWVRRALGTAFLTASEEKCLSVGAAKPMGVTALYSPAGTHPSPPGAPWVVGRVSQESAWDTDHSTSLHNAFCPIPLNPQEWKGCGELF